MLEVSVVMSVYDEPEHVRLTIDSVLAQKGVVFEFIIISDGASDEVGAVLESYKDPRLKIVKQQNQGLTKALINGCEVAQAPFISRIDAGDLMKESRLKKQYEILNEQEDVAFVTSWVRMQTEEGYFLYDVKLKEKQLNDGLISSDVDQIKTPVHSSVMFRKSDYMKAGAYRPQFYFSQDCDLWPRLLAHGKLVLIKELLTVGIFSASGISGRHADTQNKMKLLVAKNNLLRQLDKNESSLLLEAQSLRPLKNKASVNDGFNGYYFIARILTGNKSKYAKIYWYRALKSKPWNLKAWMFGFLSLFYFAV